MSPVSAGRRWHLRLTLIHALLDIFPPVTLSRTRVLALKACGVRMGYPTFFWGLPTLIGPGPITSRLKIGSHCGFNYGCVFDLTAPITVADHVSVGHEVQFLTAMRQESGESAAPITISDGVWIGARCKILAGVTIGAGCVIGAGMTVTADVPANTLMTGGKPISLAKWR